MHVIMAHAEEQDKMQEVEKDNKIAVLVIVNDFARANRRCS